MAELDGVFEALGGEGADVAGLIEEAGEIEVEAVVAGELGGEVGDGDALLEVRDLAAEAEGVADAEEVDAADAEGDAGAEAGGAGGSGEGGVPAADAGELGAESDGIGVAAGFFEAVEDGLVALATFGVLDGDIDLGKDAEFV